MIITETSMWNLKRGDKVKLELRDRWDCLWGSGEKYVEIKIDKAQACCVKQTGDLLYVIDCFNGMEVYSDIGGPDFPLRYLTEKEKEEIIAFAKEQLAVEDEMERSLA